MVQDWLQSTYLVAPFLIALFALIGQTVYLSSGTPGQLLKETTTIVSIILRSFGDIWIMDFLVLD